MSADSPAAVLVDPSDGTTIKVVSNLAERYVGVGAVQDVKTSSGNSSVVQLAAGASFTGAYVSTFGVAAVQVCVYSDQTTRVEVQQSQDHVNWDIVDLYDLPKDVGDGRTTQAVAEYVRVVITNLGPGLTTEFRVQTILCPVVEALPRSLTPLTGALKLSRSTRSFAPAPQNFQHIGESRALTLDVNRSLVTRSTILTDELSFRSDFTLGALYIDLSGTCYFRNGQDHVVGIGTSFLGEILIGQFLRLDADPDSELVRVRDVFSDTDLVLEDAYLGTTGNGVGKVTNWFYTTGAGGSLTQAASEMRIASGPTSGSLTGIERPGDYLPFVLGFQAKISQRIVDQEANIGLMDGEIGLAEKQACVVFDGTDNTKIKFRSSFSSTDVEDTTVTLPFGAVTSDYQSYQIKLTATAAVLWINNVRVADHSNHIPGPYDNLELHAHIQNTDVPASSTTLTLDSIVLSNFDRIEIGLTPQSEPLSVREVQSSVAECTNVNAAVADTVLLAYNQNRVGAAIYNDSASAMYLKLGTGASPTSFTVLIKGEGYYEVPFQYLGPLNGYWVSAVGTARVTELA
jgi:hypothetical protein